MEHKGYIGVQNASPPHPSFQAHRNILQYDSDLYHSVILYASDWLTGQALCLKISLGSYKIAVYRGG